MNLFQTQIPEIQFLKTKMHSPKIDSKRRLLNTWLWRIPVVMAVMGIIWLFQRAYRTHFRKTSPPKKPYFINQLPTKIIPLSNFKKLWDSYEFSLEDTAAIVIHVPKSINGGISVQGKHFIAFSRICTHLGCPVNLNTNIEAIVLAANHRVENPALICPCHLSLFDVFKAGQAISGPARAPLPRIQLTVKNNSLVAIGLEQPHN